MGQLHAKTIGSEIHATALACTHLMEDISPPPPNVSITQMIASANAANAEKITSAAFDSAMQDIKQASPDPNHNVNIKVHGSAHILCTQSENVKPNYNLPISNATLRGVYRGTDMITMIRWSKTWGFICIDRKARATLHGHPMSGDVPINLCLHTHAETTSDYDIFENEDHDLIFFTGEYCRARWFLAKDIKKAREEKKDYVFAAHPEDRSGGYQNADWLQGMKRVHHHQVAFKEARYTNLNTTIEWYFHPQQFKQCFWGYKCALESPPNYHDKKENGIFKGEWNSSVSYTYGDVVNFKGTLYMRPPDHPYLGGTPNQSWRIYGEPNKEKTTPTLGKMNRPNSMCFVPAYEENGKTFKHWWAMIGHDGIYTLWMIPNQDLYLVCSPHAEIYLIPDHVQSTGSTDPDYLLWGSRQFLLSRPKVDETLETKFLAMSNPLLQLPRWYGPPPPPPVQPKDMYRNKRL